MRRYGRNGFSVLCIRIAAAVLALLVALCVAAGLGVAPAAAQPNEPVETPGPPAGASASVLMSLGYYREAALSIASRQPPYDLETSLLRGELLLLAGDAGDAATEFRRAKLLTPPDELIADYALALCSLKQRSFAAAADDLARCTSRSMIATHREELALAAAALYAAQSGAVSLPSSDTGSSLLEQEVISLQVKPASAAEANIQDKAPWALPGGVPRVDEPLGLRADALVACAAGLDANGLAAVASPLARTSESSLIISALLPNRYPAPGAPPARQVAGWIRLAPAQGMEIPIGSVATYLIDGQIAAVVNSEGLTFRWDTARYSNGRHSVQVAVSDSDGGRTRVAAARYFDVRNPKSASAQTVDQAPVSVQSAPSALGETDRSAVDSAWQILVLQPNYVLGERALALRARAAGNAAAALAHEATAQAIAFDGSSAFLQQLSKTYGNRLPVTYKNTGRGSARQKPRATGLWRGNPDKREAALTFDDGPSATFTPPLLDALEAASAPGTFFVVGERAQIAPDLILRMRQDGDEVEDHSYSHPNLDQATPQHVYEEILRNAVIVQALTGIWPHFLRPPGGQSNPRVLAAAARCGMTGAFWTLDALSAENTGSPAAVESFVLRRVLPGAVILLHNGPYATTRAIPLLVAQLRQRGYKIVTLSQLARDARQ